MIAVARHTIMLSRLRLSEMCWRFQHCVQFKAALCTDLISQYGEDSCRNHTLDSMSNCCRTVSKLLELTQYLQSEELAFHPFATKDLKGRRLLIETYNDAGPILKYELHRYINMNRPDSFLLKEAYISAPYSRRLASEVFHNKHGARAYCAQLMQSDQSPIWLNKHQLYFLPATEMAIGHYAVLTEFLEIFARLGSSCRCILLQCGYGKDYGLLEVLTQKYPYFSMLPVSIIDKWSIYDISALIDSHPRHHWFTIKEKEIIDNALNVSAPERTNVVLHVRSAGYKNDAHVRSMAIRSSSIDTYIHLPRILARHGFSTNQVTADPTQKALNLTNYILVKDEITQRAQWDTFLSSSFIIGTPSGVSHFSAFTNFSTLLTNYSQMPTEYIFGTLSLVACKRALPKAVSPKLSKDHLVRLFIKNWVLDGEESLSDYITIYDLQTHEMEAALAQFLDFRSGRYKPMRFSDVLMSCGVNLKYPLYTDWSLASTTASDLKHLLLTITA